jgi:hypothetical protein
MFFSVFWRELRFAGFAGTPVSPQPRLGLESLRVPKGLRRVDDSSSGGKVCPILGVNCILILSFVSDVQGGWKPTSLTSVFSVRMSINVVPSGSEKQMSIGKIQMLGRLISFHPDVRAQCYKTFYVRNLQISVIS